MEARSFRGPRHDHGIRGLPASDPQKRLLIPRSPSVYRKSQRAVAGTDP